VRAFNAVTDRKKGIEALDKGRMTTKQMRYAPYHARGVDAVQKGNDFSSSHKNGRMLTSGF
jgi:hypothetical protein